ncbi:exosome complex exonuclease Rrp41 [Candidatus Woesearchaeota archaeon]|nr:exosome complex exonuclease Rrp41 [Candidatus Woesearchaeota archaeon]
MIMTYEKRSDGRRFDELRPIDAKVGVIPRAVGSAWFKIGKTEAYAAVYGPRELYPKFLQDPLKGFLRCHYNMMPFSGSGERVRPGSNRRAKEISLVMERALRPVVDLSQFPNAVVDVFVELPQTDAGTRCAGICAASMALADAGIPMRDLVCAVSAGKVEDKIILDLMYDEDSAEEGVDIPIAMLANSKEISLLQMDGMITKEELMKAIGLAKKAVDEIYDVQKVALKERFDIAAH